MTNTIRTDTGEFDIDIPTPVEVAAQLEGSFNREQAEAIAEHVYQPIRDALKSYIISNLK